MNTQRAQRILELLGDYVGTATATSTPLETNNQVFFEKYFAASSYFTEHPELCGFDPVPGDALGRCVPWALYKGGGPDTIVMIHHSDTVDTEDYGGNRDAALRPRELTERYRAGAADLDREARRDLEGGWLFGRGVADMKGGACIHLALLEQFSGEGGLQGSLLLLALPDEENLSAGMRSAVSLLTRLKEEHGLNYVLLLNAEPQERGEEDLMRLYDGSVGKLMPIFYARGKLAHVGQVFHGVSPVHLLSEIVALTELNADLMQQAGNTKTPPPAWLYLKDRKEVYDVSLPLAAAGYMSVLTLDRPAMETMEQLMALSRQAFSRVLERAERSYRAYTGDPKACLPWKVNVKTYSQVYREALAQSGEALIKSLRAYEDRTLGDIRAGRQRLAEAAFGLIEVTLAHLKDSAPVVVLAMSPPYYPHVNNAMLPEKNARINALLGDLETFARERLGCGFHVENYYTGISDLSYGMFESSGENTAFIRDNLLLWGEIYSIPFEQIRALSIPVLNIGPWGKDFHKYSERVNLEDLTRRVPAMVEQVIRHLLG